MYCFRKNCLDKCSNCDQKFVVMADVDYFETEYFCFDTYDDAKECWERIEKHNFYYGLHFLSKTAVLLKPENGIFSDKE